MPFGRAHMGITSLSFTKVDNHPTITFINYYFNLISEELIMNLSFFTIFYFIFRFLFFVIVGFFVFNLIYF